jgi:hypothetical protein
MVFLQHQIHTPGVSSLIERVLVVLHSKVLRSFTWKSTVASILRGVMVARHY